ncbi:YbdD/YjiX family protein [Vulcaniibacterium tengchongense]|nr:YbdD/YjiX family protein [Vulcaniibacterium tengchongense]
MRSPADLGRLALDLLARWWRASCQTARLAIGIPDYDVYVEHVRRTHPGLAPMSREEFFRERMDARYGKGRSRCC